MAFITSESPNILVKEFDLSGIVPAVTTSTGAMVGDFNWGPIDQPILIGNENELASNFGSPDLDSAANPIDFLTASTFLKYSSNSYVTRIATDDTKNAVAAGPIADEPIKNEDDFEAKKSGLITNKLLAKYAGVPGNSLTVSICPADEIAFNGWEVNGISIDELFDGVPQTSEYVASKSGNADANDEVHVVVIDADGVFTGVPGTVLETFPYLSLARDAKKSDGSANYVLDVLNNRSSFVWATDLSTEFSGIALAENFSEPGTSIVHTYTFSGGVQAPVTGGTYQAGFDVYQDEDTIQVDMLIAPGLASTAEQTSLANYITGLAAVRKDCVAVVSPPRDEVVGINNTSTIVTNVTSWARGLNASSYLITDNNYLKVYDKYNDSYVFIPAAPATAGIFALTDNVAAPWFSPAGQRRGQYFGVTSLAYNATKSQRDTLYKAGVNPIVNLPGQGILLYGDKTMIGRPSAFDRINVRRLFLGVERAIKAAAQNVMFEFNDEFTRAEFVNIVEPFLREIQGRRGITDFRVVCDETNNTPEIIDTNQFVASIFIKPARSINYVTLNFVAVRTGVDFDEVVGLV